MTDDIEAIVKREVDAARKILREDRLIQSHGALKAKLDKHFPDETEDTDDGKPKPPAKKDNPGTSSGEKKPGIWWGAVPSGE